MKMTTCRILRDSRTEKRISSEQAKAMVKEINSVPANHPVLGDMAMILSHPDIRLLLHRGITKLVGIQVTKKEMLKVSSFL